MKVWLNIPIKSWIIPKEVVNATRMFGLISGNMDGNAGEMVEAIGTRHG